MSGLRERHKQSTRRSLEEAALRLFAERGYDATTIEAIAADAGVSPRTFFRYFGAKDEVLDMGWHERQAVLVNLMAAVPEQLDDPAAAASVLRAIAAGFVEERDRLALRLEAAALSPTLRGRIADALVAWGAILAESLAGRHGLESADLRHRVTAAAAMATWVTAITHWLGDPGSDLIEVIDLAFGDLGAGARPDASGRRPS